MVADLVTKAPELNTRLGELVAVPNGSLARLAFLPNSEDLGAKIASWCCLSGSRGMGQQHFSKCLGAEWAQNHNMVRHDDCPAATPKEVPSKCAAAGRCLCSASGKALLSFRSQVSRALKLFCPNNSPA